MSEGFTNEASFPIIQEESELKKYENYINLKEYLQKIGANDKFYDLEFSIGKIKYLIYTDDYNKFPDLVDEVLDHHELDKLAERGLEKYFLADFKKD